MSLRMRWELPYIQILVDDLNSSTNSLTAALYNCGQKSFETLRLIAEQIASGTATPLSRDTLNTFIELAHAQMSIQVGPSLEGWLRLYTDASILISLEGITPLTAHDSIATLDRAIIICGKAGGRLDLILLIIEAIQREYFTLQPYILPEGDIPSSHSSQIFDLQSASSHIPNLPDVPSLVTFQSCFVHNPFILRGYAHTWPAMCEHPWHSASYLRFVSGPGRVVPIEVGKDYQSARWTQALIGWDQFISSLGLIDGHHAQSCSDTLYLAQYDLLTQFPRLRADIIIPDYAYASIDSRAFLGYQPPGNDEGLVINAWLGPGGTVSPAHTDPYFNLFVQVVGRKTVWLAPPNMTPYMYPHSKYNDQSSAATSTTPSMTNTSRVDVFSAMSVEFPDFWNRVVPKAMGSILEPGDLLFIPPGWWHAMRSEETSFSVSVWF